MGGRLTPEEEAEFFRIIQKLDGTESQEKKTSQPHACFTGSWKVHQFIDDIMTVEEFYLSGIEAYLGGSEGYTKITDYCNSVKERIASGQLSSEEYARIALIAGDAERMLNKGCMFINARNPPGTTKTLMLSLSQHGALQKMSSITMRSGTHIISYR